MLDTAHFSVIVQAFFPDTTTYDIRPIGEGHINNSYVLIADGAFFLLQRINDTVFPDPILVVKNHQKIINHLSTDDIGLVVPGLVHTNEGEAFLNYKGIWRVSNFIRNTQSFEYPQNLEMAGRAADALARFFIGLNPFENQLRLTPTIARFHDFQYRYQQFLGALEQSHEHLVKEAFTEIAYLQTHALQPNYTALNLLRRTVHNDPKMSNFLLDQEGEVVALIDLDTVMGGTIITDFGDMIRSMAVTASEEEQNMDKVKLRLDYCTQITRSLLTPLGHLLRSKEWSYMHTGPEYITLEQMMRFLMDFLEGDRYYRIKYPKQNLMRARNQMVLHKQLVENRTYLKAMIDKEASKFN